MPMQGGWLRWCKGEARETDAMMWTSAADFFAMGGYGFYVWTSYAICAACMLAEPLLARQRHRQAFRNAALQTPDNEETA